MKRLTLVFEPEVLAVGVAEVVVVGKLGELRVVSGVIHRCSARWSVGDPGYRARAMTVGLAGPAVGQALGAVG